MYFAEGLVLHEAEQAIAMTTKNSFDIETPSNTDGNNSSMHVQPSSSHNDSDDNRDSTSRLAEEFESLEGMVVLMLCQKNPELRETIAYRFSIIPKRPKSNLAEIKMSYDKDGWTPTIRATGMKFQWTRFDTDGNVDTTRRLDMKRSAYVRKLDWEAGDDRMRKGRDRIVSFSFLLVNRLLG
jgi:hypothetical protein